jgi:two-component system sensor kinase FixL
MASTLAYELDQPLSAIANDIQGCIRILPGYGTTGRYDPRRAAGGRQQALRAGEIIRHLPEFTHAV